MEIKFQSFSLIEVSVELSWSVHFSSLGRVVCKYTSPSEGWDENNSCLWWESSLSFQPEASK